MSGPPEQRQNSPASGRVAAHSKTTRKYKQARRKSIKTKTLFPPLVEFLKAGQHPRDNPNFTTRRASIKRAPLHDRMSWRTAVRERLQWAPQTLSSTAENMYSKKYSKKLLQCRGLSTLKVENRSRETTTMWRAFYSSRR